jgi:intein-encoded DNA endonuclease-like protein
MELTPALVRIHAHLCGDGSICEYKSTEKDHKIRAAVLYWNTNPELIESFRRDMTAEFGVKMTYSPKSFRLAVQSLRIARQLLSLSQYKTRTWRVPECIKKAPRKLQIEWIKAFAYDDGYTPKERNVIRLKCMNYHGLKDIKEMVDKLRIKNSFTGPNCDGTWYVNIWKEKEFANFTKKPSRK